MVPTADAARRFGGVQRLFGDAGLARLRAAHVVVAGIGGVGSWAVEALARSGVGRLTLIDLDHIAESNLNRQVHALESTIGAAKIEAMARRIAEIAPDCRVIGVDDFLSVDNIAQHLAGVNGKSTIVIDAIDQVRVKAALAAYCKTHSLPLLVCGAAGGRIDPLALRRDDLALTQGDALLASVRARLRRDHQFPRTVGQKFGVTAIYSGEVVVKDVPLAEEPRRDVASVDRAIDRTSAGSPLACSGYGSIVTVTATMGLAAAQWAINTALSQR